MKKNLCKTLVMMLVMSSITLTVKATDLSDLFKVGKIYTIREVGAIIEPYHILADFFDATSVTNVFCFISQYDNGQLYSDNYGNDSYTPTSEAKFLCASFSDNGDLNYNEGFVYFTAYEEYTPTLDVTGVGTLTVTPQPCGIGQTATITASGNLVSIAVMMGENGTDGTIEIGKTYTYQQIVDFATSTSNNISMFDAYFDTDKLVYRYDSYFSNEDITEDGLTVDEAKKKKWYAVSVENYFGDFRCRFICGADIPLTTVTEGKEYTFTMPCVNPTIKATFLNFDSKAEYVVVTYKEGSDTKTAYYKATDVEKIEWLKGEDITE